MIKYKDISKKQVTETAIVFALAGVVLGLVFKSTLFYYIAAALLLIVLLLPSIIKPAAFLWWNFSVVLSWFMTRLILTILFLFLVTPVGLFRRAVGKDNLRLKPYKKDKQSVFTSRNHTFTDADLKYPF